MPRPQRQPALALGVVDLHRRRRGEQTYLNHYQLPLAPSPDELPPESEDEDPESYEVELP